MLANKLRSNTERNEEFEKRCASYKKHKKEFYERCACYKERKEYFDKKLAIHEKYVKEFLDVIKFNNKCIASLKGTANKKDKLSVQSNSLI